MTILLKILPSIFLFLQVHALCKAQELAILAPAPILSLPQDLVLSILIAKFHSIPSQSQYAKWRFADWRLLSKQSREQYAEDAITREEALTHNLRDIKTFMLTNRTWARWLAESDFTHRFIKAALLVDPFNDMDFDIEKEKFTIDTSMKNLVYGEGHIYSLFAKCISNFQTSGVKMWLKKLFTAKPKAKLAFQSHLTWFIETPQFIEDVGVSLTIPCCNGSTPLQRLLENLGDYDFTLRDARNNRVLAAIEYILKSVSVDLSSFDDKYHPLLTKLIEKQKK